MNFFLFLINSLFAFGTTQDPCERASIQKEVESSDLVAVVSLNPDFIDLISDSVYVMDVHKAYKGKASDQFLMTSSNYTFEKDTRYLVFGNEFKYLRFRLRSSINECYSTVELAKANPEMIEFLEERWVSKCYSRELEDELKGKAGTSELQLFCGCDGKTYENFGHLRSSGITQYTPGECNE